MAVPEGVRIGDLSRFVAVVDAGGFSAAARVLGESAKQVSRRVAALEAELGVRLLHRTTRTVRPTPEGAEWYGSARSALEALELATERLRPEEGVNGRVRVQVPTLFVDAALAWLGPLMQEHPGLAVDLLVGDQADDMLALGLDLVLTAVPPTNAGVVLRRLETVRPQLVAHRDYLARHGTPERPEELGRHDCLRFHGERAQTHWTLVHEDGTVREVPVGGRLASNDSRTLFGALEAGLGIGPRTEAPSDGLVAVLPRWRFSGIELYLAVAPGRRKVPRVRLVADGLEVLAQQTARDVRG